MRARCAISPVRATLQRLSSAGAPTRCTTPAIAVLTVTAPGVPANDIEPDGSFTHPPSGSFVGTDLFTRQANDGPANA